MPSLHPHRQRQPAEALQARASRDIKKRKEKTMCTVSINIDEATMRRINPGLTSRESIRQWLQQQVDMMVKEMAYDMTFEDAYSTMEQEATDDDEETMSVEELRAMLHETIRKEYALP